MAFRAAARSAATRAHHVPAREWAAASVWRRSASAQAILPGRCTEVPRTSVQLGGPVEGGAAHAGRWSRRCSDSHQRPAAGFQASGPAAGARCASLQPLIGGEYPILRLIPDRALSSPQNHLAAGKVTLREPAALGWAADPLAQYLQTSRLLNFGASLNPMGPRC